MPEVWCGGGDFLRRSPNQVSEMWNDGVSRENAFLHRVVFFGTAMSGRRTLAEING